ncbi:MHCK/EF2 kinase domain protein (macronuclear) [Tetrahymena thermophila SB210]|uniref:MHCK/EF2 kinase domain protein n=1 Tax=Tetrahymena thermophila (strain SB210) TaxID=312017 RepID=W7XBL0_TETTS|nr:MHCK/EF2 kinase domain protein [Tetrahymena thermophila SB210]EWS71066.1 MHCK/EF2 kinase domain protein [Tetrahymena thermophila SB210]|eukprot:XP_012656407.1 MHCK/EF2 kinase domain protein [Tetrahymena thermophila SB210]
MNNEIEIPNSIMDNLMSKNNEKRNLAGKNIEDLIRQILEKQNPQDSQVYKMIQYFTKNLGSTNINDKRGSIKAITSIGIALKEHEKYARQYVKMLTRPLIDQMQDNDSKIRFACLEGLYHITFALQDIILLNFKDIFETLVTKVTDMDNSVRSAATTLDNQLKTIVQAADFQKGDLKIEELMELINKKIVAQNPTIKSMLLSWIKTLDSIPGVNMLRYLPKFLEQLFLNMSDSNREIRQSAELCLRGFLEEIMQRSNTMDSQNNLSFANEDDEIGRETHEQIINVLIEIIRTPNPGEKTKYNNISQMNCVWWIHEYLQMLEQHSQYIVEEEEHKCERQNPAIQALLNKIPVIIQQTLYLLSNEQEEIRRSADKINQLMLRILEKLKDKSGKFSEAMPMLQQMLDEKRESTAQSALVWMRQLIKYYNKNKSAQINQVLSQLIAKLYDSDSMVENVMEVLGNILKDKENFDLVIGQILKACFQNQKILNKSDIIIKQLCNILNPELVFKTMASELRKYDDINFVSPFVRSLDLILLTDSDLKELRNFLKNLQFQKNLVPEKIQLFVDIFKTWSYNPVSAITLCFLTQAYELAYNIIMSFCEIELNKSNLTQICELIYLLEKPIFVYLRLQLLEHEKYPYLLKSLHGLMMLLPQGETYNLLASRIKLVGQGSTDQQTMVSQPWDKLIENKIDTSKMVEIYLKVQIDARIYKENIENLNKLKKQ